MTKPFHVIREGILLEFREEPEGGYTVAVPALPGCLSFGETFEEAMTMIDDAMTGWLAVARDEGFDIPEQFAELARAS
jgi:predicted RNase H-like HicB family nuclease